MFAPYVCLRGVHNKSDGKTTCSNDASQKFKNFYILLLRNTQTIGLWKPDEASFPCFTIHINGDPVSDIHSWAGIVIALSMRALHALLDWIPVNIHSSAISLNGSAVINVSRLKRLCLFVIAVYAPTHCS